MPRKKVIREIELQSDGEQQAPVQETTPAPVETTTTTTTTVEIQPKEQPQPSSSTPVILETTSTQPLNYSQQPKPKTRKPRKPVSDEVKQQRLQSLERAREARLRKQWEKEMLDKQRREQEQERRMEQKIKQMIDQQMRVFGQATYKPVQPSLSRRLKVRAPPQRAYEKYSRQAQMMEESYDDDDEGFDDNVDEEGEESEQYYDHLVDNYLEKHRAPTGAYQPQPRQQAPPTSNPVDEHKQKLMSMIFHR